MPPSCSTDTEQKPLKTRESHFVIPVNRTQHFVPIWCLEKYASLLEVCVMCDWVWESERERDVSCIPICSLRGLSHCITELLSSKTVRHTRAGQNCSAFPAVPMPFNNRQPYTKYFASPVCVCARRIQVWRVSRELLLLMCRSLQHPHWGSLS